MRSAERYKTLAAQERIIDLQNLAAEAFDEERTDVTVNLRWQDADELGRLQNTFRLTTVVFADFLNFLQDRGGIHLWEEYQIEDAKRWNGETHERWKRFE